MAKKFLILYLTLFSFCSFSYDTIIISDLDDTIKKTNVDRSSAALFNALFTKKAFAGMSDLFETMQTYSSDLYILSNSPNLFRFNIKQLLKKHDINYVEVSTRNLLKDKDAFAYKYNYVVKKIIETGKKAILIGDDVGEDPEVYLKVKQNYPQSVAAIYIHKVKNRKIPIGVIPYISVFDIALNEYLFKRMNLAQAQFMGDALISEYAIKNVIPKFAYCPKSKSFWAGYDVAELNTLIESMVSKVTSYCLSK